MSLELVVESPKKINYTEYSDREPAEGEVLIQTTVSGIKHGTELNMYRGTLPFAEELWDPTLRLFRPPNADEQIAPFYPKTVGSWAAGVVLKAGPGVSRFKAGDRVHGEWKHRQTATLPQDALYHIPEGVDSTAMIFTDPARFALGAVHDAAIKVGDRVAVFGMGAIGMLAWQIARLNGAGQVCVVDPIPERLALAKQMGADVVINPRTEDAGLALKNATGGVGVDVAIEISGVYAALQHAIRGVHREGLVVTASYYGDQRGHLDLSREWHHNRVELRSSMPVWGCAHRSAPMWNLQRLEQTAVSLLESHKLQTTPLIGAQIPFARAAEAYALIDENPSDTIKVLLTYN